MMQPFMYKKIRHGLITYKNKLQNFKFLFEKNFLNEEKYQIFGPKWDLISDFFINRTPESIKNQYKEFLSKKLPSKYIKSIDLNMILIKTFQI